MGTDIHLNVERRDPATGIWHLVRPPLRECYRCEGSGTNPAEPMARNPQDKCWRCGGTGKLNEAFYTHRNYDVFAILADVRNGTGFAGSTTGSGFIPIAEPRGLPDDMSDDLKNDPQADLGDHSQSWLLVSEILDFDWDLVTIHRGVVDPWNFEQWRKNGHPECWSAFVGGGGVTHVTSAKMAEMIDDGTITWTGEPPPKYGFDARPYTIKGAAPGACYYTTVRWKETYEAAAADFLKVLREDIVPLDPNPENLRLVFGFDS